MLNILNLFSSLIVEFFFLFMLFLILFFSAYYNKINTCNIPIFQLTSNYQIICKKRPLKEYKKITLINWVLIIITTITLLMFLWVPQYTPYWHGVTGIYNTIFIQDIFTISIKTFISFLFLILLILSQHYWDKTKNVPSEMPLFLAFSTAGLFFLISTNNLILFCCLFILLSLLTTALINSNNFTTKSAEGSVKNYIISAIASILLLIAIFLIHSQTKIETLQELYSLAEQVTINQPDAIPTPVIVGIALLLLVFLIKLGAAPFHQVLVDAYEAAPLPVAAYLLGILKFGFFCIFIKLTLGLIHVELLTWPNVIKQLGYLSLLFGILPAFSQTNIRRLLNYSTVANLGLILILFNHNNMIGTAIITLGVMSIYAITIIGIFGVLLQVKKPHTKKEIITLTDLIYITKQTPMLSIFFTLFILSLAGIPPFTGFAAKFNVLFTYIDTTVKADHGFFIILLSVVPIFYYLRLCKIAIFDSKIQNKQKITKVKLKILPLIIFMFIILLLGPGMGIFTYFSQYWETAIVGSLISSDIFEFTLLI